VLGSIVNTALGFEFYGLADASGNNVIAGISFYVTGNEPAGFEIDNLTFGAKEAINPQVPEPGTMLLLASGAVGLIGRLRRRLS
ncbi:MAG TPA: PEP-CTERM sorting domain-containing protein, partial [Terriglobales bacterium]|nr:PEP-CTERM sorting domain-containing protein [Terriglobales bacterium]